MSKKPLKDLIILHDGNIIALDERGSEIPALQTLTVQQILAAALGCEGFAADGCNVLCAFAGGQLRAP